MGQQCRRVRIAVEILCISWHTGHPPKAMEYITCRVMSFRPWQASSPTHVRVSRLHEAIILSPLLSSFHRFHFPTLHSLLHFTLFSLPSFPCILIVYPFLFTSFASWCMPVSCDQSITTHFNAVIQKPHINTGIPPRDYLSVACLTGRVLLCNLHCPMNRAGLGKEGIWTSLRSDWILEWVQYGLLGIFNISVPYGVRFQRWGW